MSGLYSQPDSIALNIVAAIANYWNSGYEINTEYIEILLVDTETERSVLSLRGKSDYRITYKNICVTLREKLDTCMCCNKCCCL